ncbi:MAG: phosphoribosyltransferase [Firmicutes bacterium]|nr:phosphoribosyltransferase [Bacillota bacterium]
MLFENRSQAGKMLADRLLKFRELDPAIFALLRGGVPVGYEIAERLYAPLYPLLPRKLGAPSDPELAIGAVAQDGTIVLNEELVGHLRVTGQYIQTAAKQEMNEIQARLRRYQRYLGSDDLSGKVAILVDDGIATGYTMLAAAKSMRRRNAGYIVIASPVAPPDTAQLFIDIADETIILETPMAFLAVGQFYRDFSPVLDDEVESLLERHVQNRSSWHSGRE